MSSEKPPTLTATRLHESRNSNSVSVICDLFSHKRLILINKSIFLMRRRNNFDAQSLEHSSRSIYISIQCLLSDRYHGHNSLRHICG